MSARNIPTPAPTPAPANAPIGPATCAPTSIPVRAVPPMITARLLPVAGWCSDRMCLVVVVVVVSSWVASVLRSGAADAFMFAASVVVALESWWRDFANVGIAVIAMIRDKTRVVLTLALWRIYSPQRFGFASSDGGEFLRVDPYERAGALAAYLDGAVGSGAA